MTYRLFYTPGSAAVVVRVMLEEIGAPYELVETTTDRSKPRPPEQMAINPNGWIPVLAWEGGAMYEAAAITIFLVDRHHEAQLGPASDDPDRALFLQTLVYFTSAVQTAFQMTYYPDRFVDSPEDEPSAQRRSISRLRETLGVVEEQIGSRPWVLGDRFSALDIYLTMLMTWLKPEGKSHPAVSEFPNIARIVAATEQRPAVRAVFAEGGT